MLRGGNSLDESRKLIQINNLRAVGAKRKPAQSRLKAPPRGEEQSLVSSENTGDLTGGGAGGGAAEVAGFYPCDQRLAAIIESWPLLPESAKDQMALLAQSVQDTTSLDTVLAR